MSHLSFVSLAIIAVAVIGETAVLKTWESISSRNENVFIELSKATGGYKVSVDFARTCADYKTSIAQHFADPTYQTAFFSALKVSCIQCTILISFQ